MKNYDLIIIGSGPAGITAGIYATRYNLNSVVIGEINGGAIAETHKICNYPGMNNITGFVLTSKFVEHLKELGGSIINEKVIDIKKKENFKVITNKNEYYTKKIIIAIGSERKKLNVKGEDEFLGKGVSYCATCDAPFYKNKIVGVVGGGNSALTAAILLSEYAKKVYIIYRREKFFRVEPMMLEEIKKKKNVHYVFNSEIIEIYGKDYVRGVKLNDGKKLILDGVFIEIGSSPNEDFSKKLGIKTEKGYIIVDKKQRTNVEGVFAAGEITDNPLKQIITACAEGAIAATTAYEELKIEKS